MGVDELVERARRGQGAAFDELVRRYRERIFALTLHITGSRSDADDLTQEAFVRAWRRIGSFEGRSHFFTWLYRIALNRALNHRRDQGRRPLVSVDDDRILAALAVDAEGDPRGALLLAERYALLLSALDALTPALKATVILVALQGMNHAEAAEVLGTQVGTIGWRMHEARRKLRASLERESSPPPAWRPQMRAASRLEELLARLDPWAPEPIA